MSLLTALSNRRPISVRTLRAVFLLAVLYAITGRLALMLALPPGYASAFFPPAGIAVAMVVVRGTPMLAGVALGSFTLNAWLALDQGSGLALVPTLAAIAVAAGSTLQAWVGNWLLKRLVLPALDAGRDVLLFLLLAPLMCVSSASFSITGLYLLGIMPAHTLSVNWATWWVGDTIGVLLAAPLAWIFLGEPRVLWWRRRWFLGLPLALSSAVFIAMYVQVSSWEQEQQLLAFRLKSQQIGDILQHQFSEHEQLMYAMAGLFSESHTISSPEFDKMAQRYLANRPALQGMGWAPRVTAAQRAEFERWAQQNVSSDFFIKEFPPAKAPAPAANRAQYYPVLYFSPHAGNERVLGLDMLSEPVRAAMLAQAAARDRPTASESVRLVNETVTQHSILLAQAIRFHSADAGDAPLGMLVMALRAEDYLQRTLAQADSTWFSVRLEDPAALIGSKLLMDTLGRMLQTHDYQRQLNFGGRLYVMTLAPTAAYWNAHRGWQSRAVLAIGLLLTGLLGAFLLIMSGQRVQIEAVVTDSTRKLHEREARLTAILGGAADAILTVGRDGALVSANGAAARMFGYQVEDMQGLGLDRLLIVEQGDSITDMLARLDMRVQPGDEANGISSNGKQFPLSIAVSLIELPDEAFFVCILHDLTEQRRSQEQIYQLAHQDALTGLDNRFTLNLRLEQLLALARRNHVAVAVLFIDLDHFKKINDSHGHQIGDLVLVEAGRRLKSLLREADTVARLGGDEFVVVLARRSSSEGVSIVAERVVAALTTPYVVRDKNLRTGASIGICMFPDDGNDVNTLLRNADTAMYAAKSKGRGKYQFYSDEMNRVTQERLLMENRIWLALENKEFELFLQPVMDLASGGIVGAEALIRWNHPDLGLKTPDHFIPIAEESGLILPLGEWVLTRAMTLLAEWQRRSVPRWRLAINLSARQCNIDTLIPTVDRLIKETGIDVKWLEMEITETAAMQDPVQTQALLHELRKRGIKVSIDDFGTGYSSLSYLKLFAIDRIKIDRSFVKDIETDPNDAIIASATIALAHTLGLEVIAEGVETEAQRAFLQQQLCDEAQGYLFGRPMPVADFEKLAAQ